MRKKIISILCVAVACLMSLTACNIKSGNDQSGDSQNNYNHNFTQDWYYDENNHWHSCENCDEENDLAEHDWGIGDITTPSTCTTEGIVIYKCRVCNKIKTDTVPKKFHLWNDGEILENSTCSIEGQKLYKCTVCNEEKIDKLPLDSNAHSYDEDTWDNNELQHWHPASCGHHELKANPSAHILGDWVMTKEPTKTEEGLKEKKCKTCNYSEKCSVEKIDYDYTEGLHYELNADKTGYIVNGSAGDVTEDGKPIYVPVSKASTIAVHAVYNGLPVVGINSLSTKYSSINGVELDEIVNHIKTIIVPETVSFISAFGGTSTTNILISENNPYYASKNGIVYSKDMTEIIKYPSGKNPTSVVLQEGLLKIHAGAFSGCTNLKSVSIPNSIVSVGANAFYYQGGAPLVNSGICKVEGYGMYLGNSSNPYLVFYDCRWWNEIPTINSRTKVIASGAVNVKMSGDINVPNSVEYIGSGAFSSSSLTNFSIGSGVKEIGDVAFPTTTLSLITVSAVNEYYMSENGILYNKNKSEIICYPSKKADLDEFEIPDSCKTIASYCFANTSLKSIKLPDGIQEIGARAFSGCANLATVNLPEGVSRLEESTFSGCGALKSISIPKSIQYIGFGVFSYCNALEKVYIEDLKSWCEIDFDSIQSNPLGYAKQVFIEGTLLGDNLIIPDGVSSIGNYAFQNRTELKNIYFSESVKAIGYGTFQGCSNIETIRIPQSVNKIGGRAFQGWANLKKVEIDDISAWCKIDFEMQNSNPLYYAHSLYLKGEQITDVCIPNSIREIKKYAFSGYSTLEAIVLPDNLEAIGDNAFDSCRSLKSIVIPDSVTVIGNNAFYQCQALSSVTIGRSVESIGRYAFDWCCFDNIKIPASVTKIDTFAFNEDKLTNCIFEDCEGWSRISNKYRTETLLSSMDLRDPKKAAELLVEDEVEVINGVPNHTSFTWIKR